MASRFRGRRGGFTHVDLLAVGGVLLLLGPLLLAVVRDTGERARVTQCLSNLHGLMRATSAYLVDYPGEIPLIRQAVGGSFAISTWTYGGKTNDDYWQHYGGGEFFIPATKRPLNPYLLGAAVQPDVMNGTQVVERTPISMLRCPSDRYTHQRTFDDSNLGNFPMSCYDDVGTSYQYNLHGLEDTNIDEWGSNGQNWLLINRALVADVLAKHSSLYTIFVEDPMDWGLPSPSFGRPTGTLEIGNHGQLGKHSAGYLDGHGDYIYRDTRRWCGVDWASIVPSWRYNGMHSPPIYYRVNTIIRKNCDP
jgi:hypothetical protein